MVSCSVLDCTVTYSNNPNKETFHRFPINAVLKETWSRILKLVPHKNSMVCSRHFKNNCFVQRKHRRLLKKESIPTEYVPVNLKPKRPVSTYIYRDIWPEPSTSQSKLLTPTEKQLINKCSQLKQKIKRKQQIIINLKAKAKRLHKKIIHAEEVIEELQKRPSLQDN